MTAADIESKWQDDRTKYPTMEKDTFVRNCLFNRIDLAALGEWLYQQEDLHGQVFEGGASMFWNFTTVAGDDGETWTKADPSKPYVNTRILIEVVRNGTSRLFPKTPWCGDD